MFLPQYTYRSTILLLLLAAGCEFGSESNAGPDAETRKPHGDGPLAVACTTGQVGDLVKNLGGSHVTVTTLMGPGVDPHLYRGTLADSQSLNQADVVFYNGLHLEGRLADSLESLASRKPVFAVTEQIAKHSPELLRKAQEFDGNYDPHVWFDVALWSRCGDSVTERLIELDPQHAEDYRENSQSYQKKLKELDARCRAELSQIPPEQRLMVTAHDAFGYLGRAYDIDVRGLQGISTADEVDLATVKELVDLLVSRKVKAVFVESSVPPKTIQSLIQGCAARGHAVVEGGELFSDALGPADSPAAEYVGMVGHNIDTIVKALK